MRSLMPNLPKSLTQNGSVYFLAFATVSLIGILEAAPVWAQEKVILRTLTVSGRGTERVATTMAQVQLGVEAQGKTAEEVRQKVAEAATSVVNVLKSRRVERLETIGVQLNPLYDTTNNKQKLIGYTASTGVRFRMTTDATGSILDDAVKAGATRIDGVSFVASDSAIAEAQKAALRKAAQEAQSQASAVLESLGLKQRDIVSVQVNGAYAPPPQALDAAQFSTTAKLQGEAIFPLVAGEQQVDATVTLQVSY